MKKHLAIAAVAAAALALAGCAGQSAPQADKAGSADAAAKGPKKSIVIAEPVHGIGYLPLYAAIDRGYFAKEGLDVSTTTLTGGAHVNAVLSGNAWGFIGGIESGAIANAKGAQMVSIAGVVDRANVYWVARKGIKIDPKDIAGSIKGLRMAVNRHGGSVEIDSLYYLQQLGLDPQKDMQLINNDVSGSEASLVQAGTVDIAASSEPVMGQGIKQGLWGEPFVSLPKELGKFAYSDIVVSRQTAGDKATVKAFDAGLAKGMDYVMKNRSGAKAIAVKEFPNMTPEVIQATLDRTYKDKFWDGIDISDAAVNIDLKVARKSGLLQDSAHPATPDNILDLSQLPQ